MKIEQIYTGCLAQGAYYIESEGEAVVIDPLREVEPYLKKQKMIRQRSSTFLKPIFMQTSFQDMLILQRNQELPLYMDQLLLQHLMPI